MGEESFVYLNSARKKWNPTKQNRNVLYNRQSPHSIEKFSTIARVHIALYYDKRFKFCSVFHFWAKEVCLAASIHVKKNFHRLGRCGLTIPQVRKGELQGGLEGTFFLKKLILLQICQSKIWMPEGIPTISGKMSPCYCNHPNSLEDIWCHMRKLHLWCHLYRIFRQQSLK